MWGSVGVPVPEGFYVTGKIPNESNLPATEFANLRILICEFASLPEARAVENFNLPLCSGDGALQAGVYVLFST